MSAAVELDSHDTGSIPEDLKPLLHQLYCWDFDVFELHRSSGGHSLRYVVLEALSRFNICSRFQIKPPMMEKFLKKIEEGYCLHQNPYHNVLHGADVVQATAYYLSVTNLTEWLSQLEAFAVITAATIHDYEHTGTTNNFHINMKSDLALFYNDHSVLENYHVASVFRFMANDPEVNIIAGLTSQEYREMRNLLIEIVLGTDMSFHFAQVKNMRALLNAFDRDPSSIVFDKAKILSLIIHSADVSHAGRSWPLHLRWSNMLNEELFNQGDREKQMGMTVSPMCDKQDTVIATSQVGFIEFVVGPAFDITIDILERLLNPLFLQRKTHAAEIGTKAADESNQVLAYQDEYLAIEQETGEPCYFVPFKWDGRNEQLKIHRFYAKNIENNKAMWQKLIEVEANDPVSFKDFKRDPVIELGWVWPEETKPPAKKIGEDAKRKDKKSKSCREREVRKLREKIDRYKWKLRQLEDGIESERKQESDRTLSMNEIGRNGSSQCVKNGGAESRASALRKQWRAKTPYTRDCESPPPSCTSVLRNYDRTTTMIGDITDVTSPNAMICAAKKLRHLLETLLDDNDQSMPKPTIVESLSYVISVVEYSYQQRRISSMEEQPTALPRSLNRAQSLDSLMRNIVVHPRFAYITRSNKNGFSCHDGSDQEGKPVRRVTFQFPVAKALQTQQPLSSPIIESLSVRNWLASEMGWVFSPDHPAGGNKKPY